MDPLSRAPGATPTAARSTARIRRSLAYAVPWLSVMLGLAAARSCRSSAPVPLVPPLGFLMLLAWRLLRPGLLPVWAGFPLGLFDDLFSGQPFGSAMLLWSLAMIGLEMIEARFPWRGFYQDWLVAGVVAAWYLLIAALFSGGAIGGHDGRRAAPATRRHARRDPATLALHRCARPLPPHPRTDARLMALRRSRRRRKPPRSSARPR